MYEVVINSSAVGLKLSSTAISMLRSAGVEDIDALLRHDSRLISVLRSLGPRASEEGSSLEIVPAGKFYFVAVEAGVESLVVSPYEWIRIDEDNNN